jgi:hypothetical protein
MPPGPKSFAYEAKCVPNIGTMAMPSSSRGQRRYDKLLRWPLDEKDLPGIEKSGPSCVKISLKICDISCR